MATREALQHARTMKQQLQELLPGRTAPDMLRTTAALSRWAHERGAAEADEPLPPALHSVLQELVPLLADVSAALLPLASGPVPLEVGQQMLVASCCGLLSTLLKLCENGLQLGERDALRLLTAASLPLGLSLDGKTAAGLTPELEALISSCCEAVLSAVNASGDRPLLPPRACIAARRTTLRPQALATWLSQVAAVQPMLGLRQLSCTGRDFLHTAHSVCDVPGVPALVPPPVQEALVGLATEAVTIAAQPAHLAEAAPTLAASLSLALKFSVGRKQHERRTGCSLLRAVAGSLAARLEGAARQAQHGAAGAADELVPSHLVLLHMALIGTLVKDASEADAAGCPADSALLQATVASLPHVLVVLHRFSDLLDSVRAATGAGSEASSGGAAPTSDSSDARGPGAAAPPEGSVGRVLHDPFAAKLVFDSCQIGLIDALVCLDAVKEGLPGWETAEVLAAAAAAADRAVRLLPRLWHWPVVVGGAGGGQERVVPAHAAPAGGSAGMAGSLARNAPQALGLTLCALSFTLCATAANSNVSSETAALAVSSEAAALASFHTAVAACKWEWWQAAQEEAAGVFLAQLSGELPPLPMHPACLAAQRVWHAERRRLQHSGGSAERAAEMQRRLDCVLLTYFEALTACPAGTSPKDGVQPRMLALSDWCNWTPEVAGTDLFLADGCRGARLLMQTFADALADPTSCPKRTVISMLHLVLRRSQPSLLPVMAVTPDLLRQLAPLAERNSRLGPPIPGILNRAQPELLSIVRSLLKWLQRCAREHQVAADSSGGSSGSGGSTAVAKLLALDVDTAGNADVASLLTAFSRLPLPEAALQLPQPAAGEDDLALRRARAMALRACCANPRCTKLTGDREAGLKGRRCSGCRLVRYCCEACSKLDWQAHKRACRLLRPATPGS